MRVEMWVSPEPVNSVFTVTRSAVVTSSLGLDVALCGGQREAGARIEVTGLEIRPGSGCGEAAGQGLVQIAETATARARIRSVRA
jgi:hypothetical protein